MPCKKGKKRTGGGGTGFHKKGRARPTVKKKGSRKKKGG